MKANETEGAAEKEEIQELARAHDSRTNGGGGRINWNNRIKNEVSKLLDNDDLQKNKVYYIPKVSCKLRLGYTNRYMTANITKIEVVDGKDTDLHIDKPVYAIHLANVREEKF